MKLPYPPNKSDDVAGRIGPPDKMSGDTCLLLYADDTYTLMEEDYSTYDLGTEPKTVDRLFENLGLPERVRDLLVGFAREFGSAKLIFSEHRVFPMYTASVDYQKKASRSKLRFQDGQRIDNIPPAPGFVARGC